MQAIYVNSLKLVNIFAILSVSDNTYLTVTGL